MLKTKHCWKVKDIIIINKIINWPFHSPFIPLCFLLNTNKGPQVRIPMPLEIHDWEWSEESSDFSISMLYEEVGDLAKQLAGKLNLPYPHVFSSSCLL